MQRCIWHKIVNYAKSIQLTEPKKPKSVKNPSELNFNLDDLGSVIEEVSKNEVPDRSTTPVPQMLDSESINNRIKERISYHLRLDMKRAVEFVINKLASVVWTTVNTKVDFKTCLQEKGVTIAKFIEFMMTEALKFTNEMYFCIFAGYLVVALKESEEEWKKAATVQKQKVLKVPKSGVDGNRYMTVFCYAFVAACFESGSPTRVLSWASKTEVFEETIVRWNGSNTTKLCINEYVNGNGQSIPRCELNRPPAGRQQKTLSSTKTLASSVQSSIRLPTVECWSEITRCVSQQQVEVDTNLPKNFLCAWETLSVSNPAALKQISVLYDHKDKAMIDKDIYPLFCATNAKCYFQSEAKIIRNAKHVIEQVLHEPSQNVSRSKATANCDAVKFLPAANNAFTHTVLKMQKDRIGSEAVELDLDTMCFSLNCRKLAIDPIIIQNPDKVCPTQLLCFHLLLCLEYVANPKATMNDISTNCSKKAYVMYGKLSEYLISELDKNVFGFDDTAELKLYTNAFGKYFTYENGCN